MKSGTIRTIQGLVVAFSMLLSPALKAGENVCQELVKDIEVLKLYKDASIELMSIRTQLEDLDGKIGEIEFSIEEFNSKVLAAESSARAREMENFKEKVKKHPLYIQGAPGLADGAVRKNIEGNVKVFSKELREEMDKLEAKKDQLEGKKDQLEGKKDQLKERRKELFDSYADLNLKIDGNTRLYEMVYFKALEAKSDEELSNNLSSSFAAIEENRRKNMAKLPTLSTSNDHIFRPGPDICY